MRDLKFRAWDHVNNIMVFAGYHELREEDNEWVAWDLPPDSPTNTGMPFEVMQFTGLTDRDGVKIYEGDILSMWHAPRATCVGVVKFDDCSFKFITKQATPSECHLGDIESLGNDLEVIGNIYENAELL